MCNLREIQDSGGNYVNTNPVVAKCYHKYSLFRFREQQFSCTDMENSKRKKKLIRFTAP